MFNIRNLKLIDTKNVYIAQSVERCVKLVTEASLAVYGQERRHALIVARQASRKDRPSFDVKSDFVV